MFDMILNAISLAHTITSSKSPMNNHKAKGKMKTKTALAISLMCLLSGCKSTGPKTIGDLLNLHPTIVDAVAYTDSIQSLSAEDRKWVIGYLVQSERSQSLNRALSLKEAIAFQKQRYQDDSLKEVKRQAELKKLLPAKQKYDHPFAINVKYNKFKDFSNLDIMDLPLTENIKFMFFTTYSGSIPPKSLPQSISCMITSTTDDWKFLTQHDVTLLVNGSNRLHYETKHDGKVGSGYVLEFLMFEMPTEDFLQIVNADSVEVQIFTTEAKLTKTTFNGMRDFASRLVP